MLNLIIFFLKCCIVMQLNNANNKKIIKKNIISFLTHKSFKNRNIINLKIEILDIITTFSIA